MDIEEWARPELNWRSSPCQGDVITPRPRARYIVCNFQIYLSKSVWYYPMILEIFPVQPSLEQVPAALFLPLLIS